MKRLIVIFTLALPFANLLAEPECHLQASFEAGPVPMLTGSLSYRAERDGVEGFYKKDTTITKASTESASDRDGIVFFPIRKGEELVLEFRTNLTNSGAGEETIYSLLNPWFPVPEQSCLYSLSIETPKDFMAISEGEAILKEDKETSSVQLFSQSHPSEMAHLILSDSYIKRERNFEGIKLAVYFSRDNEEFMDLYLDQATATIQYYESILGDFPYSSFSMVESDEQVGMSMPTFTLLGSRLIPLPFLIGRSLDHEIFHQWFGNFVRPSIPGGNWSEGLANLMADLRIAEEAGNGADSRRDLLMQYQSFVPGERDFPLREFTARYDRTSQSIGYGKGAFLFSMLRDRIGKPAFEEGLRHLVVAFGGKEVAWLALQKTFETISNQNLDDFFYYWLNEPGLPQFSVSDSITVRDGEVYVTKFRIQTGKELPVMNLDLRVIGRSESTGRKLVYSGSGKDYTVLTSFEPIRISLDDSYRIARRLAPEENPAVLSRVFGSQEILFIVERANLNLYRPLYELFYGANAKIVPPSELDYDLMRNRDLVFLDRSNSGIIPPYDFPDDISQETTTVAVRQSPWNKDYVAAVIHAPDSETLRMNLSRASHYGKYREIRIDPDKRVEKGETRAGAGMPIPVNSVPEMLDGSRILNWEKILKEKGIKDTPIVFVGEQHNKMGHHLVQLDVIRAVHKIHPEMGIGMEMFSREAEGYLNDFIAGKFSEKELLYKTDYFNTWGYDYAFYRPILLFARENKIPIVPLNIDRNLIRSLSRSGGVHGLESARELPAGMDFSDENYRSFLKEIFTMHMGSDERAFEGFFQAQILWDEAMASAASRWLMENPGKKMVALAGNGHLIERRGLPERTRKRTGASYILILNDEENKPGNGDFIVQAPEISVPSSSTIGVQLQATESGRLEVKKVFEESVGKSAGLEEGDVILQMDGEEIRNMNDIKIQLFFLEPAVAHTLRIQRGEVTLDIPLHFSLD